MSKKKAQNDHKKKDLEIYVDGHPVSLSFAAEHNPTAAQRVRACLIDSFIRQVGAEAHQAAQG